MAHIHLHDFHLRRLLGPPPPPAATALVDSHGLLDRYITIFFATLFVFTVAYLFIRSLCSRRQPRAADEAAPPEPDPACVAQLRAIPVLLYEEHRAGGGETECCAVCLSEYAAGEEVRAMPRCKHVFHRECIDGWLAARSPLCPVCRGLVIERSPAPGKLECCMEGQQRPQMRREGEGSVPPLARFANVL